MKKRHSANAYRKDILRNIAGGKKRFIAIAVITALGVMMFSGLEAACEDSRRSADVFYDAQNLHDLVVVSTLGLTGEDVEALQKMDGILLAEGSYSEDVKIDDGDGAEFSVELQVISEAGIDAPYLVEGTLPLAVDETVITEYFSTETGLGIGDIFTVKTEEVSSDDSGADPEEKEEDDEIDLDFELEEEDASSVVQMQYTITGIVIDPTDVDNPMETSSFRTTGTAALRFFVLPEAVDSEIFTAVNLIVDGASDLWCYSDEYEIFVDNVKSAIEEEIKEDREEARTASVVGDAQQELDDARSEAEEALLDAEQELLDGEEELETELADAEQELKDAEQEIADGWAEIEEAKEELADARQQLSDAGKELDEQEATAQKQIADARTQLEDGIAQLSEQIVSYQEIEAQLTAAQQGYAAGALSEQELEDLLAGFSSGSSAALSEEEIAAMRAAGLSEEEIAAAAASQTAQSDPAAALEQQLLAAQQAVAAMEEQLAALELQAAELDAEEESALQQIAEGRAEIEENWRTLEESEAEIADAERELADGEQELSDGWEEYYEGKEEGEAELSDGWETFEDSRAKVEEKLADAQTEIDEIEKATWYVQNRFSLSGYSNVDSDAESIESIAEVFPVVFLAVAILISLTTVSRMVDEDRGLFGTYKSLGFTDNEIRRKYLIYAAAACGIGSILGSVLAFVGMPLFVFMIFDVMYILPAYYLWVLPIRGLMGAILFLVGILAATWRACYRQLRQTPATLMRPKSPREGQRVILERIPLIWNHLSFLNKVTARNIFRYKGRMFMTIFGVGGCMALLLFGFAIDDSVTDLMPRQYEQTSLYDIMVVASAEDNDELLSYMEDDPDVEDFLNLSVSSVSMWTGEDGAGLDELTVQLIVVPDDADISSYIYIEGAKSGEEVALSDGDVYFTRNAGDVLGFDDGDTVTVQLLDLQEADLTVTAIVTNYLSNYIYMSESTFERYFDEFEENALLIHLSDTCEDQIAYGEEMKKRDGVVSCISTQELIEDFSGAFILITMVVYLLIVMSAALAFTVLFTLSTTNTSEREREIATIKVLGFYDNEVHAYINKETLILTGIGVVLGIPLGYAFAQTLTGILRLPSLYLAVSLHPVSYVYSAGLTIVFALIVTLLSNRTLNRVDPATALKSVE